MVNRHGALPTNGRLRPKAVSPATIPHLFGETAQDARRRIFSALAVVALEEGAELFRKTAAQSEGSQARRLINQAKSRQANAKLIREMLEEFNDQVL